ncbi:MAG: glycosyltransferase family 9 protein [Bacteroidota bacterium]|nr:glycosyltransferase family 9 protein [Bacteroidota bacterium]
MVKTLIISRTDSIGDVVLTLPVAGVMKSLYPDIRIFFIGRTYTGPIIETCEHIDRFINWDEISAKSEKEQIDFFKSLQADTIVHVFPNAQIARIAWKSSIPLRIGTSHRLRHWYFCNKLINFSRKKSSLHEAQLNLKLFSPLGVKKTYLPEELSTYYGLSRVIPLDDNNVSLLDRSRFNLILHPKSKGSAREWGLENFGKLIELLPPRQYKIFISGTLDDRKNMLSFLDKYKDKVTDITGKLSLPQFISFINQADGLVAASTGPLHIAAALGKTAIGLYAPMRPIHPGRWMPIGIKSSFLVQDKECNDCRNSNRCECIESLRPEKIIAILENTEAKPC